MFLRRNFLPPVERQHLAGAIGERQQGTVCVPPRLGDHLHQGAQSGGGGCVMLSLKQALHTRYSMFISWERNSPSENKFIDDITLSVTLFQLFWRQTDFRLVSK